MNQQIQQFLPLILLFVVFYFLILRPQQKRQKDHRQLIDSIKQNDVLITVGGMHGKVVKVKDTTVILRIAEKVEVEYEKSAISKRENS
jgi:preprotein translocase subunit YajC